MAHVLLGIALLTLTLHAVPETPVPEPAVTMVFEAPVEPTVMPEPQAAPEETAQAEPPPPEPEQAVAEAAPPQAVPEPEPEPPPPPPPIEAEQPPPPPPPPPVQAEKPPPPPPPQAKPPPKRAVARAEVTKPAVRPAAPVAPAESAAPAPVAASVPRAEPQEPSPAAVAWNELLSAWLASHKTYPEIARRRGQEGTVTLRFTVAADGNVLDVAVVSGSGNTLLDEAAQQLLRGARLPAPPAELTRTVRVRYRLEG